jgi:signal transduction histidine kinase
MGTHGASMRPRALPPARRADKSTNVDSRQKRQLNLTDWPVARRLFAVIVAALLMGLVFGGLRVADTENSASQFSKTEQLAKLSALLIPVAQDLQNERDATDIALISGTQGSINQLQAAQGQTNRDLVPVRAALQGVLGGGFSATVQSDASAVNSELSVSSIGTFSTSSVNASGLHGLFAIANSNGTEASANYEADLAAIATLQAQVSLGVTDQSLNSDVQTLSALAQAKDLTSQEQSIVDPALANNNNSGVTDANNNNTLGHLDFAGETSLQLAYNEELTQEAAFHQVASPAENAEFDNLLGPEAAKLDGETESDTIDQAIFAVTGGGALAKSEEDGVGIVLVPFIQNQLNDPAQGVLTALKSDTALDQSTAGQERAELKSNPAIGNSQVQATRPPIVQPVSDIATLQTVWDKGTDAKLAALQTTEQSVAGNIVSRATQLQQSAQQSALTFLIITVAVLLVVLGLALLVARSLVLPLRRLRAGALDIASVQLPERVRLLSENPESASSMDVAPINVTAQDEIGQVARAFDQVHQEAVRLAGEQALLRSSFNAMFVNLSRRSQTLIERLARMIDNLEQNEDDPDRLGSLFSMDHLVTRMRRNSENLLLLAGHENPRKWSESVPLADIARAATSEIEQYNRVTLNIAPGVSIIGQAVSDVVHLLAELVENATIFSPKDTQVQVGMQELTSGGVLIEVVDKGIGVSEARLTDMNWRLDNPPTIDVSVSRHMGLFAVARLAERHRVRVRLRPAPPQGLSALVWLPDSVIERTNRLGAGTSSWSAQPAVRTRVVAAESAALTTGGQPSLGNGYSSGNGNGNPALEGRTASGWFRGGQDGTGRPAAGTLGGQDGGFAPDWGTGAGSAATFGESSPVDQTASGLPVRVPRANMPSGANGGGAADGQAGPPRAPGNGRPAATAAGSANSGHTLPRRSPDQARSRLAGFQRGTRRAEGQGGSGGQAPRAGEGTLS